MSLGITGIAWPFFAGMCLTSAFTHLLVWVRNKRKYADLAFFFVALSVATLLVGDLLLAHSKTPEQYGHLLQWLFVPACVFAIATVFFIRIFLGAGRLWLGVAACGTRLLALMINFVQSPNIYDREVTSLREVVIWGGETVTIATTVTNPWQIVANISSLLLFVFILDAIITVRRRSTDPAERRRALVVGSSFLITLLIPVVTTMMIHWHVAELPFHVYPIFVVVILAISYELSADVVRAATLTEELAVTLSAQKVSEERFQNVVESASTGMLITDRDGVILLVNAQVEADFGFGRDELLGQPVEKLIPPRFQHSHSRLFSQYTEATTPKRLMASGREIFGYHKEGRELPLEITLSPLRNTEGFEILVSIINITERKQAEQVIAQQRNELAHLSRVMMLSELSGSLAHELNQPLAAILSNAQAALRFLGQEATDLNEIRDILRDIVDDDKRAGEIIKGLRQMLKKGDMQRDRIDPNALVLDVIRLMRSDMLNGGIHYKSELAMNLPQINGIYVQLQQVLLNLIVNACDAMSHLESDRQLLISTRQGADNSVVFCVSDKGPGIPDESAAQIFDPFYTTKSHGLGLGLAVCRRIVDAHGGQMWANNNNDRGASFSFSVPACAQGGSA